MEIECTTLTAAGLVVYVLLDAGLQSSIDFTIANARELDLPITFVIPSTPPADMVRWLECIPDTAIVCA